MTRATSRRSGDPNDVDSQTHQIGAMMPALSLPPRDELLGRITTDERILGGKPIIRGMRFAVEHILGMLAAGDSADTILSQYPILEPEDIQACLVFAHRSLYGRETSESAPIGAAP